MIGAGRDVKVRVWDQQIEISVYQKSKSVWMASGTYLGQHIEVKGASAGSATRLWVSTATYRGN